MCSGAEPGVSRKVLRKCLSTSWAMLPDLVEGSYIKQLPLVVDGGSKVALCNFSDLRNDRPYVFLFRRPCRHDRYLCHEGAHSGSYEILSLGPMPALEWYLGRHLLLRHIIRHRQARTNCALRSRDATETAQQNFSQLPQQKSSLRDLLPRYNLA